MEEIEEVFDVIELLEGKQFGKVREVLSEMNNVDIAELFDDVSKENAIRLFRLLNKDDAADVFSYMEPDAQQQILEAMSDKELREVLDDMFLDDTVDMLGEMPANLVSRLLKNTSVDTRVYINQLLNYPDDSAGSIMTIEFVDLKADMTVEEAFAKIKETAIDKETVYTCYVTDRFRILEGVVTVHQLLIADRSAIISDLMDTHAIIAHTHDKREDVALNFSKYGLLAMPVVDGENRLVGIVTVDDAMDVLEKEVTEDIETMAAIVHADKPYLRQSVWQIWKNRIPWLLLLMISATFTGKIISSFEDALAVFPALTAFIPMLMDTGGNAGGQASATIVRGLALDEIRMEDIFKIWWKEFRVSLMMGVTLAVVNFLKILVVDNMILGSNISLEIGAVICVTLFTAVVIAKLVGSTLPIVAKKIGFDPAVMASPFITTIVDALALLVYFAVASAVLGI